MNRKKLAPAELSAFCAQVSLMLSSGLPVFSGMETLAESARGSREEEICASLCAAMQETGSLSDALRKDGRWPGYMVEMTAIGERAGCLETVMNGLAVYYDREGRIRSAIRSAVTYPMVLGAMMLVIILIMITRVLPVFRRVLGGMGIVFGAGGNSALQAGTVIGWAVLALVGVMMLLALACVLMLRTGAADRVRRMLNRCLPPVRRVSRRLSAARTASVLAMLLSGGFPLDEALAMVPGVLDDADASAEVQRLHKRMCEGVSFEDALAGSSLFDPLHSRMIRMGAAVGREDQVMETIARSYEEDVEEGVSRLVSIIEPTLVAFLCVIIGLILLSVMLPMAGIISAMI